jgi:site-specific DNA-methyltransferase (cytosine-N4-specific)
VKDSFTRIWWLSNTPYPKANNNNVKVEYSLQMKKLINSGKYNSGKRPSEYVIGEKSFAKDNGGAIPSNVLIASHTTSQDCYLKYCKENNLLIHPARMPLEIAEFFIKFLTEPGDLVIDPFAGSNVTGSAAEKLNRKWLAIEASENYVKGSTGRFSDVTIL